MAIKKRTRPRTSPQAIKFANFVVEGEPLIDAYYKSFKTKANKNTASKEAVKLSNRDDVAALIAKGRAAAADKAQITAADLIKELEEARQIGKREMQPAAMVGATMGKAKLLGLDKVVVEIQSADELTPWSSVKGSIDK